eukprot:scaffold111812_cov36-Tisochrysis_lutea.AAC.4
MAALASVSSDCNRPTSVVAFSRAAVFCLPSQRGMRVLNRKLALACDACARAHRICSSSRCSTSSYARRRSRSIECALSISRKEWMLSESESSSSCLCAAQRH